MQSIQTIARPLLPRTGQTNSYANGDDAWFQAGLPVATRFVDNQNGTVTDRATGLQWVKDPSQLGGAFGTPGTPTAMTWADALANCLALEYAGFTDWRLPNWFELACLYDLGKTTAPMIDAAFACETGFYWSGSPRAANPAGGAYYVNFSGSYVSCLYSSPASTYYVRPVRGGRINAHWA